MRSCLAAAQEERPGPPDWHWPDKTPFTSKRSEGASERVLSTAWVWIPFIPVLPTAWAWTLLAATLAEHAPYLGQANDVVPELRVVPRNCRHCHLHRSGDHIDERHKEADVQHLALRPLTPQHRRFELAQSFAALELTGAHSGASNNLEGARGF